jgi:hypothetical protein
MSLIISKLKIRKQDGYFLTNYIKINKLCSLTDFALLI